MCGLKNMRMSALSAFLLMVACTAYAADAPRGPRIFLPEQLFDFGRVTQGSVPEHVFVIRNSGTELLQIRQVRPS
jgi:hypothetical protein